MTDRGAVSAPLEMTPAARVVRAPADAVLEVAGPILADHAILLLIDWHDGHTKPE